MTVQDWIDAAREESSLNNMKRIKALETLLAWPLFTQEWGWTGLGALLFALQEVERRKEAL